MDGRRERARIHEWRVRSLAAPLADLGESPVWDVRGHRLCWVDGRKGQILCARLLGHEIAFLEVVALRVPIGSIVPLKSPLGDWIVACGMSLLHQSPQGVVRPLLQLAPDGGRTQLNDSGCDPAGRLFVGSMDRDGVEPIGALYRVNLDGRVDVVADGITISNGIGWSPDGRTMYFVDSALRRVDRFDYNVASGTPSRRRPAVQFEEAEGLPDGLSIDVDGGIWIALWDGGEVRRYEADGTLTDVVRLPVSRPTSCAFVGSRLDQLVITTASAELDPVVRAAEPDAGRLFICQPHRTGLMPTPYRGSLQMRTS